MADGCQCPPTCWLLPLNQTPGPRGGRQRGGVYTLIHPHKHSRTHSHTHCFSSDTCAQWTVGSVLVSHTGPVQQRSGECEGRGCRVSTGLLSCISLLPSKLLQLFYPPHPLPLLPMPCQIHISHNRAESSCRQRCINHTALSCFCLSPH